MSTMAPEAAPAAPVAEGGQPRKVNVLTRKIGPLPTWGWVVIVSAVLIGVAYWRSRQSGQAAAATPTGTDASQVPQFVNQTFTSVTPPTVPPPPAPTPGGKPPPKGGTFTVERNETLRQLARTEGWNAAFTRAVERLNKLRPASRLHKGQVLKVPSAADKGT